LFANFKKAYVEAEKTDPGDAFVIADRLRFGRLPRLADPDQKYLAIQKLTRHRFHLTNSLVREKNRFLSHLFLKFSAFCQEEPLSDPFGAAAGCLLTEFLSVDEIAQTLIQDLVDFLVEKAEGTSLTPKPLLGPLSKPPGTPIALVKLLPIPSTSSLPSHWRTSASLNGRSPLSTRP
jgi:hypothetical protein